VAGLYLLAPALAFGVLGAHFFRSAGYFVPNYLAIAVCIAMTVLLFVRRPWAARAVQVALVLGAIEWVRWTFVLVNTRQEVGAPYLRLALILGGVALLTALCALLIQTPRLRAYFRL
jgi:hypothetical protein